MFNMNGPPKGFNVTSDQSSYDLVSKDFIISSALGTPNADKTSFNYLLRSDNMNKIYKAELVAATVKFNSAINSNVLNQTLLLNIPQLNGNTFVVSGSNPNQMMGANFFSQVPDNCTPLTPSNLLPSNIISLFICAKMFDCVTYYNPPIDKVNKIDVLWNDQLGNYIPTDLSGSPGTINSFYFTLRVYYFQKRNTTSSFSTSVLTYADSGTEDSIFRPKNY
jgi:hypothetical protein